MTTDLLRQQSCLQAVKAWFAENELLPNALKSDVMFVGTSTQLFAAKLVTNIVVAGANLPPTDELKSLGVLQSPNVRSSRVGCEKSVQLSLWTL